VVQDREELLALLKTVTNIRDSQNAEDSSLAEIVLAPEKGLCLME
jgi:hypothetical protein